MTVLEMHYDFDIKFDIVSQSKPSLLPEEKDWILNEAQTLFVKQKYQVNNLYRKGFEATQKRIDDLRNLVVRFPDQPEITEPTQVSEGLYEVPFSLLKYPYLFLVSQSATVIDPSTGCSHDAKLTFVQHDDLYNTLKDPFNKPYKEEVIFTMGNSSNGPSMYIHTGDVILTAVKLDYIRHPKRINLGGYTYIDGEVYPTQNCELASHTHTEIVDIAVTIASRITENPDLFQNSNFSLSINE